MLFKHSMSIAQQLIPIYNTTLYKNKTNVAINLMWLTVECYETGINGHFRREIFLQNGKRKTHMVNTQKKMEGVNVKMVIKIESSGKRTIRSIS